MCQNILQVKIIAEAQLSNFQNGTMYILTCKNPNRIIQNSLAGMPHGLGQGSSKPKSKQDRLVWSWKQATYKHAIRGQLGNSWSHPCFTDTSLVSWSFQRCGLHNARPMQPRRHRKNDQQSEPVSSPKPGSGCCQTDCGPPTFKDFLVGTGYRIYMKFRES